MTTSTARAVLVTGASKGIGLATATLLADRGFHVYAGYRDEADGRRLGAVSDLITPVRLDVTRDEDINETVGIIRGQTDGALHGLVNNAGIVEPGPLEGLRLETVRYQFEVNVFGLLALTQACLPLLRAGGGRIVNVSSINGRIALPFNAPYAASKFALEAMSDGLRLELAGTGVLVSVIQPGAVQSHIWEDAWERAVRNFKDLRPEAAPHYDALTHRVENRGPRQPPQAISAAVVARKVHHALTARRPKLRYLVGWDALAGAFATWLLPDRWLDWFIQLKRRRAS